MWWLRKVSAFMAHSFRHAMAEKGDIAGRALLYVALLFVFSRLWKAIGVDPIGEWTDFVWYLALTEWVLLSVPNLHLDIEADIRSGDIVTAIPRPICYVTARSAEGLGGAWARMLVLGVVGMGVATCVTGGAPPHAEFLWQALVTGDLGVTLGVLFAVMIGLSALWLHDVGPCYWAWQKTVFIFGGLLVPLDIYPRWLHQVAEWTPCHAMLYSTGSRVLEHSQLGLGRAVSLQLAWIVVVVALLALCYRRAIRYIDVNGG